MLTDGADISPKYNPEPETVEGCVNLWYLIQFWMSKVTYILFDKGLLYFLECNSEQNLKSPVMFILPPTKEYQPTNWA